MIFLLEIGTLGGKDTTKNVTFLGVSSSIPAPLTQQQISEVLLHTEEGEEILFWRQYRTSTLPMGPVMSR